VAARAEAMTTTYPQKITFGELRKSGVRDVLVYCRDQGEEPGERCGAPGAGGGVVTLKQGSVG
jgi:hypothetical protein